MEYIQFALSFLIVLFIYIVIIRIYIVIAGFIGEQFREIFMNLLKKYD